MQIVSSSVGCRNEIEPPPPSAAVIEALRAAGYIGPNEPTKEDIEAIRRLIIEQKRRAKR
jgi:hypothetical protein